MSNSNSNELIETSQLSKIDIIRRILRITPLNIEGNSESNIQLDSVTIIDDPELLGIRIKYNDGSRIIDWENGQWISYVKEGVSWYKEDLMDNDYDILYNLLATQISLLFRT
jgi:hypothetical protein